MLEEFIISSRVALPHPSIMREPTPPSDWPLMKQIGDWQYRERRWDAYPHKIEIEALHKKQH